MDGGPTSSIRVIGNHVGFAFYGLDNKAYDSNTTLSSSTASEYAPPRRPRTSRSRQSLVRRKHLSHLYALKEDGFDFVDGAEDEDVPSSPMMKRDNSSMATLKGHVRETTAEIPSTEFNLPQAPPKTTWKTRLLSIRIGGVSKKLKGKAILLRDVLLPSFLNPPPPPTYHTTANPATPSPFLSLQPPTKHEFVSQRIVCIKDLSPPSPVEDEHTRNPYRYQKHLSTLPEEDDAYQHEGGRLPAYEPSEWDEAYAGGAWPGEKKPPTSHFAGNQPREQHYRREERPLSSPYIARNNLDDGGNRASIVFSGDDGEEGYLDAVLMPIENLHSVTLQPNRSQVSPPWVSKPLTTPTTNEPPTASPVSTNPFRHSIISILSSTDSSYGTNARSMPLMTMPLRPRSSIINGIGLSPSDKENTHSLLSNASYRIRSFPNPDEDEEEVDDDEQEYYVLEAAPDIESEAGGGERQSMIVLLPVPPEDRAKIAGGPSSRWSSTVGSIPDELPEEEDEYDDEGGWEYDDEDGVERDEDGDEELNPFVTPLPTPAIVDVHVGRNAKPLPSIPPQPHPLSASSSYRTAPSPPISPPIPQTSSSSFFGPGSSSNDLDRRILPIIELDAAATLPGSATSLTTTASLKRHPMTPPRKNGDWPPPQPSPSFPSIETKALAPPRGVQPQPIVRDQPAASTMGLGMGVRLPRLDQIGILGGRPDSTGRRRASSLSTSTFGKSGPGSEITKDKIGSPVLLSPRNSIGRPGVSRRASGSGGTQKRRVSPPRMREIDKEKARRISMEREREREERERERERQREQEREREQESSRSTTPKSTRRKFIEDFSSSPIPPSPTPPPMSPVPLNAPPVRSSPGMSYQQIIRDAPRTPISASQTPVRMSAQLPARNSPALENQRPPRASPALSNQKPARSSPALSNQIPVRASPALSNQRPVRGSPARSNQIPARGSPALSNSQPIRPPGSPAPSNARSARSSPALSTQPAPRRKEDEFMRSAGKAFAGQSVVLEVVDDSGRSEGRYGSGGRRKARTEKSPSVSSSSDRRADRQWPSV